MKKQKMTAGEYLKGLRKSEISEHDIQTVLFQWFDLMSATEIPELHLAFAIPNGGHRHISVAKRLKAEGVKSGIPDWMIPVARHGYHGLFVEMKRPDGKVSDNQSHWLLDLKEQGYFTYCCYSADEAMELVRYYFGKKAQKTFVPYQANGSIKSN